MAGVPGGNLLYASHIEWCRSRGCLASDAPENSTSVAPEIRKSGFSYFRKSGFSKIQKSGNLKIRIFEFPEIRNFGNRTSEIQENPKVRMIRYSDVFVFSQNRNIRTLGKKIKKASDVEIAHVEFCLKSMVIQGLARLKSSG